MIKGWKNHKKIKGRLVIGMIFFFLLKGYFPVLAADRGTAIPYQWHEDENGRWYGAEQNGAVLEYYINTWAVLFETGDYVDQKIGKLYCFDENGYLRTSQITPDGYCVNENGALTVGGEVIKVCWKNQACSEEWWADGDALLGTWITIYGYAQTRYGIDSRDTRTFSGKPAEVKILRGDNGNLYAETYDLKNGDRIRTGVFDITPIDGKQDTQGNRENGRSLQYKIEGKNGGGSEIFSPGTQGDYMTSSPNGYYSEEIENKDIFYYYRYTVFDLGDR